MSPVFERTDIERFRDAVSRQLGFSFDDTKLGQLANVLYDRMCATDCREPSSYIDRLAVHGLSGSEIGAIAEQLTVAETYFFRHSDQIRAFSECALPERIQAQATRRRLRILSAGCSSGEEPYTLAIEIREHLRGLTGWQIEIIGCDVNAAVLTRARRGTYSEWSLRETSEPIRRRYFHQSQKEFTLDEEILAMVAFEERNIVDDDSRFWRPETFDIVFCRNVMMYFTPEAVRDLVNKIEMSLYSGGFLFLGPAETLRGVSQSFHLLHTHGAFYYQVRPPMDRPVLGDVPMVAETQLLPAALTPDTPWLDAIVGASERIAALSAAVPTALAPPMGQPITGSPSPRAPQPSDLAHATELLRQERYREALHLLRSLPAEAAMDPDAQLLLGVVLAQKGDVAEAEHVCRNVLALDEMNAGAHYLTALCREHAGDTSAAWEHDQTAAYLDPAFAMPHLHLGLLAKGQRRPEVARREFGQACALLALEDAARILMFGGGFNREALLRLCRAEMRAAGEETRHDLGR